MESIDLSFTVGMLTMWVFFVACDMCDRWAKGKVERKEFRDFIGSIKAKQDE